ncbi:MAG: hypothetical protein KIT80_23600 [Chitinophagaceae bacterium]|nr:hypothetical protein [Nitrosomonas sp.]MCW5929926.1 hypothetical protein [Chitinophagaceae bacterium]
MKHRHAKNMMLYVQDAMETDKPWERWEVLNYENKWMDLYKNPEWRTECSYRRKPRNVNINGFEVPEPVRSPLEEGTKYFSPAIDRDNKLCITSKWDNDSSDYLALNRGLIHLSEQAAINHAEALLSFTRIEK